MVDDQMGTVVRGRRAVSAILNGSDDRLLVIVGPCSIHDPAAGREYARRLADVAAAVDRDLCIVMRCYFEKPRTTTGWKGLINDPGLDGTFRVNEGIEVARALVLDVLALGLPVGSEFVDPLIAPFISDTVSWAAVGARTSQSPIHRQLASGLTMPVGFKNALDGDIQVAIDAVTAVAAPQITLGIADDGRAAVFETMGNSDGHVVLRGGSSGPNSGPTIVASTASRLRESGLPDKVVVDASHGNSGKDHRAQAAVASAIADLVAAGESGVAGVMLEGFLVAGQQQVGRGEHSTLTFGQSVTDACMGWEETATVLNLLAKSASHRRRRAAPSGVLCDSING